MDIVLLAPGSFGNEGFVLRWIEALNPQRRLSLQEFSANAGKGQTGAVCIFGSCDALFESAEVRNVIAGKGVIHLGKGEASVFHGLGAEAVIGYRADPGFLINIRGEEPFRDAALTGPRAVAEGRRLKEVFELQQRAWSNVLAVAELHIARMLAQHNRKALYTSGNSRWRVKNAARFVWVDVTTERTKYPEAPRIEIVDVTSEILSWLRDDPARLSQISPEAFENFVVDRLVAMNFQAQRIGSTFQRDGGIDILAWPKQGAVPFLLAVQVKHSKMGRNVGPDPVRSLQGVLATQPIDVGMVVTNTSFTPDARWVAERAPRLMRLRDFEDLKLWIRGQFEGEKTWRGLPQTIEIAPGVLIPIPRRFGEDSATRRR